MKIINKTNQTIPDDFADTVENIITDIGAISIDSLNFVTRKTKEYAWVDCSCVDNKPMSQIFITDKLINAIKDNQINTIAHEIYHIQHFETVSQQIDYNYINQLAHNPRTVADYTYAFGFSMLDEYMAFRNAHKYHKYQLINEKNGSDIIMETLRLLIDTISIRKQMVLLKDQNTITNGFYEMFKSIQNTIYDIMALCALYNENEPLECNIVKQLYNNKLYKRYISPISEFANNYYNSPQYTENTYIYFGKLLLNIFDLNGLYTKNSDTGIVLYV